MYKRQLQILAAPEGKGSLTDKQAVDESLRVLKSLSDSRKLPVVLISSLNRESYDQPVSLRSYKDTGSIEYSCDTVLGMQYRGVGARDFDVFQAQGQNPDVYKRQGGCPAVCERGYVGTEAGGIVWE